jgi:predicted DNA-binding transcriptional regulator YafY
MDYGPGGGYFLPPELYVDPVTFTGEEAIALALGGAVTGGSHLFGNGDRLRQALIKLEAVLPEEYRADVRAARERILVDVSTWFSGASAPAQFDSIRNAVWQKRQLDIYYQRADSSDAEWRRVEPLGLIWKAGSWYLAAYCHLRAALRVFHLRRVLDLTPLDDPVQCCPDFDLERYWTDFLQRFHTVAAPLLLTVRMLTSIVPRFEEEHVVLGEEADGWIVVQFRADSIDTAVARVLSLGGGAIVLDPPEVRERVARAAADIVASNALPDPDRGSASLPA